MELLSTDLPGVFVLTPRRHGDARGFFAETFNHAALSDLGLRLPPFREENQWTGARAGSVCQPGCQAPPRARGRLLRCAKGRARVAVTEGRADVPGYQRTILLTISAQDGSQIWVPAGRLAGWIALSDGTVIASNATDYLAPEHLTQIAWDSLGVDWGLGPAISPANQADARRLQRLADWKSPFTSEDYP